MTRVTHRNEVRADFQEIGSQSLLSMFGSVFNNSTVLVTGHTGFKGSWLTSWLLRLGARVHGYSLPGSQDTPLYNVLNLSKQIESDIRGDITDWETISLTIERIKPRFIFHLAAQPIVSLSFKEPMTTFKTNVMGTIHVLEIVRSMEQPCVCIIISTDKCYENREWLYAYREEDAMGGFDPYSASKGCVELTTASYRRSFFSGSSPHRIATARAGNVIGGGDWAIDRIVPDVFRSLQNKSPVQVRNPKSTRPWQHVLEPLSGYLWLAANLASPDLMNLPIGEISGSFNFGPLATSNRTVVEVVEEILKQVPGSWVDASSPHPIHEAGKLNVAIDKAYHLLGWSPTWDFATAIEKTVDWYLSHGQATDIYRKTLEQIESYEQQAARQSNVWALR